MEVRAFFLGMRIFYGAFLSSIIFVVAIAASYGDILNIPVDPPFDKLLLILPIGLGIANFLLARFIFKLKTGNIAENSKLDDKLNAYRQAFIVRSALIEGMALFTAVCYAITNEQVLLFFAGLLWGAIVYYRPSKTEVKKVFQLTPTETFTLDNDQAIIFKAREPD